MHGSQVGGHGVVAEVGTIVVGVTIGAPAGAAASIASLVSFVLPCVTKFFPISSPHRAGQTTCAKQGTSRVVLLLRC